MYKSSYDVINILELWVVYLENCYKVIIKIFNFLCIVLYVLKFLREC